MNISCLCEIRIAQRIVGRSPSIAKNAPRIVETPGYPKRLYLDCERRRSPGLDGASPRIAM